MAGQLHTTIQRVTAHSLSSEENNEK